MGKGYPKVALVDDDPMAAKYFELYVMEGIEASFDHYPSCRSLLTAMSNGTRYAVYVVDYILKRSEEQGDICTKLITTLHPEAKVIGISAHPFVDVVAQNFSFVVQQIMLILERVAQCLRKRLGGFLEILRVGSWSTVIRKKSFLAVGLFIFVIVWLL